MFFTNKSVKLQNQIIVDSKIIDNKSIATKVKVLNFKLLGVTLDNKLNSLKHCFYIKNE